jgi:hypothetical protein
MLRIELRLVVAPASTSDGLETLKKAREVMEGLSPIFDSSLRPYEKIDEAFMVRVEADSDRRPRDCLDTLVASLGGTGWMLEGDDEEMEAIWTPGEGQQHPISPRIVWGLIQTIPQSALPPSRRLVSRH